MSGAANSIDCDERKLGQGSLGLIETILLGNVKPGRSKGRRATSIWMHDARCGREGRGEASAVACMMYRIVCTTILTQLVERGGKGVGSGITRSSSSFWGGVGGKEDQGRANQGISGRAGQITYDDDDDEGGAAGASASADEGIVNCEKRATTPHHTTPHHTVYHAAEEGSTCGCVCILGAADCVMPLVCSGCCLFSFVHPCPQRNMAHRHRAGHGSARLTVRAGFAGLVPMAIAGSGLGQVQILLQVVVAAVAGRGGIIHSDRRLAGMRECSSDAAKAGARTDGYHRQQALSCMCAF
ncbi:uncharacterized protein LY79DRAFT_216278 [Colletotrichum navitas]|uniref:Uncharacterized protein n=1 Tax=Colletotrichum navitas TaxID=681940 RepID=A0AAD8PZ66_9PEZI|nr:uncharacterized protein LY79DRAFT_216278 [Colletotrichum navitas]KAK1590636.1 hypothetical protein LY79DRAFT_216278 [Colletotrichum navitas]